MGEVFLATDTRLSRPVAIKFLFGAGDPDGRERALREARAIAAIDHPNICAVYEVGSSAEFGDFIVMQYVEGEALSEVLSRGPMTIARACDLTSQVADALAAAHSRGVIHRDLKPQNIVVTPAGTPKLLDFGIAKRLTSSVDSTTKQASETSRSGIWVGTPAYMSPEQIRLEPLDSRSDLFSLGCVLYECLTGHRAFIGRSDREVLANVLEADPVAPSKLMPGAGRSVDAVCAQLLAKVPAGRYQSAAAASVALRRLGASAGSQAWNWKAVVAIAAVLVLLGIGALKLWAPPTPPEPPAQAAQWYAGGVEALRNGLYVAAKSALLEAVAKSPEFPLAYSRLAEAHSELDEESDAQAALLRVEALVADRSRLGVEERLRLDAIRSFVLRDYDAASAAYKQLAELAPNDAGRWLDVGRAEEAAVNREQAAVNYSHALQIDPQYAAAHLRLGSIKAQTGDLAAGLADLDEAIRIYRAQSNTEGEAEGLLRKGLLLTPVGRFAEAQEILDVVTRLTADPRYLSQRVRARFDLARLRSVTGSVDDGERLAAEAVKEATDAGLWGLAALGLVDLGNAMLTAGRAEAADPAFARAIELSVTHGARKTELRARLAQASLRQALGKPQEAIDLLAEPLVIVTKHNFKRFEADARSIMGRSFEDLEQYDSATGYAQQVLAFAESIGDKLQIATALDNLAGPLGKVGRLPEALAMRERREAINRSLGNHANLAFDLTLRAELLIRLGRGAAAEEALREIDQRAAEGVSAYAGRRSRVAMLRAMRAATEGRHADALRFAVLAQEPGRSDGTTRSARALEEYARAVTSRTSRVFDENLRPSAASATGRENSYWLARALAARADYRRAYDTAEASWSAPGAKGNDELAWRMKAIAAEAGRHLTDTAELSATMAADSERQLAPLITAWGDAARVYLERSDLRSLRRSKKIERSTK